MPAPVQARNPLGQLFYTSRKTFEKVYAKREGFELVADENGVPVDPPPADQTPYTYKIVQQDDETGDMTDGNQ